MIIVAVLGIIGFLFILATQLSNQVLFATHLSKRWLSHEQSYYMVRSIAEQAIKLIPPQTQKFNKSARSMGPIRCPPAAGRQKWLARCADRGRGAPLQPERTLEA